MRISRINTISAQKFGMAKNPVYEEAKYHEDIAAKKCRPGSDAWFRHKLKSVAIIQDQLMHDAGLTDKERFDLEKDKEAINRDMYIKIYSYK